MERLSSIESFVRSAEAGSFSAAARRLGLTPAAVSKNVAALEASLGVRLFQRTTRSLTLTESGESFLKEVSDGLATIQSAVANLGRGDGTPAGTLKVSMSVMFGLDYILPLLGDFLGKYPHIVPDWHFDNRPVDLVADGFDAAIGGGLELAPGLISRQLARVHIVAVASPRYLAAHPPVTSPADLRALDGIVMRSLRTGRLHAWTLQNAAGEQAPAELTPRMSFNDPDALSRAAAMDLGVAYVPMPHAVALLRSGALVRVLPEWHADAGAVSLYYAGHRLLPAKTRAFVDYLVAHFKRPHIAACFDATAPS